MPVLADIQRVRTFIFCKRILFHNVFIRAGPSENFLPTLIFELRCSPSVGFPARRCLLLIPRSRFNDPIVAQRRATSSPARDFAGHFPVFAWCLFGVYYNLEILSAVPTYTPKTA